MDVVIYHNPECGTSRNTLGLIRNAGIEPHIIEYLKCAPTRTLLRQLARAGLTARQALREKSAPFEELGLGDPAVTDDDLLDAMIAHPVLINRPFVVTPKGVRLLPPFRTGSRPVAATAKRVLQGGRRAGGRRKGPASKDGVNAGSPSAVALSGPRDPRR